MLEPRSDGRCSLVLFANEPRPVFAKSLGPFDARRWLNPRRNHRGWEGPRLTLGDLPCSGRGRRILRKLIDEDDNR